jgi:hypothetical protein
MTTPFLQPRLRIKHANNNQTANSALQIPHRISEIRSTVHAKEGKTLPVDRLASAHSEAYLVLRARLRSRSWAEEPATLYTSNDPPPLPRSSLTSDVSTNKTSFDEMRWLACLGMGISPRGSTSNTDGETDGRTKRDWDEMRWKKRSVSLKCRGID